MEEKEKKPGFFKTDKDQRQYCFRHRFTFQWIFAYR